VAGRSTWSIVAILGACILALLGAGVVGVLTVDEADGDGPGGGGVAAPSEPAPPQPPIDLEAIVVPGPSGFDQIPDARLLVGGNVDLEKLAVERGEQTTAVFKETQLVNGFVRAWQKPDTSELVTVRLYQFANDAGAASYAKRVTAAMSKPPATTFNVPATTDTVGIDTQVQQGANRLTYVFSRKGRVVSAIAATVIPPPDAGFLAPFARSQLALLP